MGSGNKFAGIFHSLNLYLYNFAEWGQIGCSIKTSAGRVGIPNTSVGLSTNGNIYAPNGSVTPFGGTVGTNTNTHYLYIARTGDYYAPLGFRQLLIFNKELSQAEVNDVLRVMFPV